ncbi:MAG TPA: MBL fold metallo-hydrolase [Anaerolineales bacterium]|nr:MBL fold metallo-hydrolase [Anaerolineales bacterium]
MSSQPDFAPGAVKTFQTSGGGRIFQIHLQEFPILRGHVYLVLVEHDSQPYRVLIDTGSGFGTSNQHLEAGLQAAAQISGEPIGLDTLTHILITHGHIDHFGGLNYIQPRSPARIGVHELDLRNLTNYEERIAIVARRLDDFLVEAGVSDERRGQLLDMYKINKSLYRSVKVDFTYETVGMRLGPLEMLHVPGHCAGHVVIRLHDVLFSGDHILNHTSPHQSPERLTHSTGLEHYLESLDSLQDWAGDIRLTLGGHEEPISDLPGRLDAIRIIHRERLEQVLEYLSEPRTISDTSHHLFGEVHGYNVLLALEEAGAHIEYLYQRGKLGIANHAEIEDSRGPVKICYYRMPAD